MTNAEQNLYRMPGIFEVHLETPKVDSSVLTRVFEELSDVGFKETCLSEVFIILEVIKVMIYQHPGHLQLHIKKSLFLKSKN